MSQSPERFAQDWISDWNGGDVARILRHYAVDQIEVRQPGHPGQRLQGHQAVAGYVGRLLGRMAGRPRELVAVAGGEGSATIIYRGAGMHLQVETLEFANDGRVVRSMLQETVSWRPWQLLFATLRLWRQRARTRAELARLDVRMLHDIGYPADDAAYEASQPFWRP